MSEKIKTHYSMLFFFFLLSVGILTYAWMWVNEKPARDPVWGVTFSSVYATQLHLDVDETYAALIGDLGVRHVRLPLYWSTIEQAPGEFDWSVPDGLIDYSQSHGVELTVVVGMKVPRWPECYVPDWAEGLDENSQQQAVLSFIRDAVNRYKDSPAIVRWQVENEPLFPYGLCSQMSLEQLKERVDLVRSLDTRPIMVTVSGEIGPWLDSLQGADMLGISMYRQTWNEVFGYFVYPIDPTFYLVRAALVHDDVDAVIVSELQAEPWFPEAIDHRPLTDWYDTFTATMFENNLQFARDARLSEVYLWGAEWWVTMKQAGDDRLWNVALEVFDEN
ncbi:endo-1,4-beta-xylanase [Candidatus Uhrbacteria bacterium]|nr:endo-1,4-beta-xylanase [Candidatus Uhrbacteria bacterium]